MVLWCKCLTQILYIRAVMIRGSNQTNKFEFLDPRSDFELILI